MSNYAPILLQVVDEKGQTLVDLSVPFSVGVNVKQIMECAFVLSQTSANPDPFLYIVEYYGYSEAAQFPGYLGYEIESICGKPTNNLSYWSLSVNGITTSTGAETTFPGPGATVLWKYTAIPVNADQLTARTKVIHMRRASRTVANATKQP